MTPAPAAPLRLSVVVPAFNEAKLIESCLDSIAVSLAQAGLRPAEFEIRVVDNDSTDDTAARATARGARVVHEPIRQIARARNRGARDARGQWLLFVDADSWPSADLMRHMLGRMASPQVAGGGALVTMPDRSWLTRMGVGGWNFLARALGWACGAFIFCRRDAFHAIGGFDERLFVGEEIGFSRRLKRYARDHGQRTVILKHHPLMTSARKLQLYGPADFLAGGLRFLRHPVRFFRDPSLCSMWYDGRR